jgi:hypothetical protein
MRNIDFTTAAILPMKPTECHKTGTHCATKWVAGPLFGIAFARVQSGDYVFGPRPRPYYSGGPTGFALVVRPYYPNSAGSGLFRLVGACMNNHDGK